MNNTLKILILSSVVYLTGCTGPQASFSEKMQDTFLLTAGQRVSASETRCIMVTRPYTFQSGNVTFSIPAGRYIGNRKNSTGYFYDAPTIIQSSNLMIASAQHGIYLNNQLNKGNLYAPDEIHGVDDRPIRGPVLPGAIFAYIKPSRC